MYCKQPDRDIPSLLCGYSLPCPYHTVIIDTSAKPVPTVTIPVTMPKAANRRMLRKLKKIALILEEL